MDNDDDDSDIVMEDDSDGSSSGGDEQEAEEEEYEEVCFCFSDSGKNFNCCASINCSFSPLLKFRNKSWK